MEILKLDTLLEIQNYVRQKIKNDPAHDYGHIMRVYKNAKKLCKQENANLKLVLPAALLHDLITYPKNQKKAIQSSQHSAKLAKEILTKCKYSDDQIKIICDAISEHSFSANKIPTTLEGKILQDADRLDAIGAIGIARVFAVAGSEKRSFYNEDDPFCKTREPDDQKWTIDHFYRKLLVLEKKMNTKSAKIEAKRRTKILKKFLHDLQKEIQ